jgi:hypothetical protein
MKRLLSLTLIGAMVAFAIVSCKDDFNEEEFLRLQSELKLKQAEHNKALMDSASEEAVQEYINAANEAGDLLAVSLIVRENGNALAGVTVTLSSGTTQEISSGRTKAVTTGVSDALGNVVFDRVTIGSGTATFSKAGFIGATATYDFDVPSAPVQIQIPSPNGNGTLTRFIPPAKRFEQGVVQMLSASATEGSTAKISGRITIENDMTNLTPEIPTGLVLRADLSYLLGGNAGIFKNYTLNDDSNLGRATINADGTYSMIVPATASGNYIDFIVPNIEGTCRIAVNGYENGNGSITPITLPTPEYRDIPTTWGPNTATSNDIPVVAGALILVPSAATLGSGLSFSFSPVGRSLSTGTVSASTPTNPNGGDVYYRIAKRGAFTNPTIPSVIFSGGGGTGASATAILQTLVKSITVVKRGEGYDAPIRLQLRANHEGGNFTDLATTSDIDPDDMQIPAFFDLSTIATNGFGVDDAPVEVPANTTSISVGIINGGNGTGAELSAGIITDLKSITINSAGLGYTSAPSIEINGGGASVEVVEFPVFWDIEPVMATGTDYSIIPDFSVTYPQSHSQNGSSDANVLPLNANGTSDGNAATLRSQLTISGGDIVKKFPRLLRSAKKSHAQPSMVIKTEEPHNARFTFPLSAIDAASGKITAIPTMNNAGNGYNFQLTGQIVPTIAGAPGNGAAINFHYDPDGVDADYNSESMEWQFEQTLPGTPNITITNQGSGYVPNLNQRIAQPSNLPTSSLFVQAGKIYLLNADFGSGFRTVKFN